MEKTSSNHANQINPMRHKSALIMSKSLKNSKIHATSRGATSEMMQPKKSLQARYCNLKRRYKRDATSSRGATSEILQPQKALQARYYNLKKRYKQNYIT